MSNSVSIKLRNMVMVTMLVSSRTLYCTKIMSSYYLTAWLLVLMICGIACLVLLRLYTNQQRMHRGIEIYQMQHFTTKKAVLHWYWWGSISFGFYLGQVFGDSQQVIWMREFTKHIKHIKKAHLITHPDFTVFKTKGCYPPKNDNM